MPHHHFHTFEPGWNGETVFIVAGGTSVLNQNLNLLYGRKVIAVNSSYEAVPWAAACFFADSRWWNVHKHKPALAGFQGLLVTCALHAKGDRLLRVRRVMPPPGYTDDRSAVVANRTSLQGAMNLAGHLGARRLVLLGADMRRGDDGRTHHHAAHQWPNKTGNRTWDIQMQQLSLMVEPLKERGIEVVNCSPISRLPWWPTRTLESIVFEGHFVS
jgi:hypothetical protein